MKFASIVRLSAATLSCAVLAACETAPQTASLQCGVGGAAAGYLLCKALGRPDHECVVFATVAGVGGAAVCYNYAGNLERRRKELAGKENDLDARIRYVHGLNQDGQQLNEQLAKRVADTTRSTDELVAQIQQKKVSADRLAKERQARDEEWKAANAQATTSSQALADMKAFRAKNKTPSADLDASLAKQQQLNDETQQLVAQLAAQKSRV